MQTRCANLAANWGCGDGGLESHVVRVQVPLRGCQRLLMGIGGDGDHITWVVRGTMLMNDAAGLVVAPFTVLF